MISVMGYGFQGQGHVNAMARYKSTPTSSAWKNLLTPQNLMRRCGFAQENNAQDQRCWQPKVLVVKSTGSGRLSAFNGAWAS